MTVSVSVPGFGGRSNAGSQASSREHQAEAFAQSSRAVHHVQELIDEALATADALRDEAIERIDALLDFDPTIPSVRYDSPEFVQSSLSGFAPGALINLKQDVEINALELDVDAKSLTERPSITAPNAVPAVDLHFDAAPVYSGTMQAPPAAPRVDDIDVMDAPDLTMPDMRVPTLNAPVLDNIDFSVRDFIEIKPRPLIEIDHSVIDKAGAVLQGFLSGVSVSLKDYQPVMGDLNALINRMQVTGAMPGAEVIRAEVVRRHGETGRIIDHGNTWGERGMAGLGADVEMSRHASDMSGFAASASARSFSVTEAIIARKVIKMAIGAAVDAHGLWLDLSMKMADLGFQALVVKADALLALMKAGVDIYNAKIVALNAQAEDYNATLINVRAHVDRFGLQIDHAEAAAAFNTSLAGNFSVLEGIKGVEVDAFKSLGKIEESKVRAYASNMRALMSKADALQGKLDLYRIKVMEYLASLNAVKYEYAAFSSKAKGVEAVNSAESMKAQVSSLFNAGAEGKAQAYLSDIKFKMSELQAKAAKESASSTATQAWNAIEALRTEMASALHSAQTNTNTLNVVSERMKIQGQTMQARAAGEFFRASAASVDRAARLTYETQYKYGAAMLSIYSQAGRSGAALESARMGSYNATISLSGSAGIGAGESSNVNYTYSWSDSMRENDGVGKEVSE